MNIRFMGWLNLFLFYGLLVFCNSIYAQSPPLDSVATDDSNVESEKSTQASKDDSDEGEAADQEGHIDLGLGELINADFVADEWKEKIQGVLKDYNLSASVVGQVIATLLVILIALLFSFLVKKSLSNALIKLRRSQLGVHISMQRLHVYQKSLTIFISLSALCLTVMALVMVWSAQAENVFVYEQASSAFRLLLTFAFLFYLAAAAFEVVSMVMEHFFIRWNRNGSARVQTLLPIVRNVANTALFVLFGITLISELGINIMPLLAGAGVIGFAVGFGAQTIIKDLITGFIIIFEDLIQVGDIVTVGGKSGIVEKITIRKIQLRSLDGIVYTVPYSEIAIVENMTKEFSYYLFNVGVAYRESPDEVIEVLRSIGKEMQEDDEYKDFILEPLDVLGVDNFADSAVVIKARIKTRAGKQWFVGREFNRRMKYDFDKAGIEIPFPHQTLYFGEDKNGDAPAARVELKDAKRAANDQPEEAVN